MRFAFLAATMALSSLANAAEKQLPAANETDLVRIVPVAPTPESEMVALRVVFPQTKEIQTKNPVDVQVRLEGFPLRTYSQFPRAREIMNYNKTGQCIHVVVDNEPYFTENEAIIDALDMNAYDNFFNDQMLEFTLRMNLDEGTHILRIFPVRSYGESLKGDGCFASRRFYVDSKTPGMNVDLDKPYLTANEPQGVITYDPKKPILLDFYLTNVLLSKDGYKVRVTIDETIQRIITNWSPYYIYGLKAGDHKIKLELLNERNQVAPGDFNTVERRFSLK